MSTLGGLGFIMQGFSDFTSGFMNAQALRAQGEYQAKMLMLNAQISDFMAQDAIKRGDKAASEYKKQVNNLVGSQRVAAAAQGVAIGEGSVADIQEETAMQGAADAVTIRSNAWREAWGHRVQAQDYRGQAALTGLGSSFSADMSILKGSMDLLSGAYKGMGAMGVGKAKGKYESMW